MQFCPQNLQKLQIHPRQTRNELQSANIPQSTTRGATHGTHIILGEISPSVLEPWLGPEI